MWHQIRDQLLAGSENSSTVLGIMGRWLPGSWNTILYDYRPLMFVVGNSILTNCDKQTRIASIWSPELIQDGYH